MKKSKLEKQLKGVLKSAMHDPLISSVSEKGKFDIITNIKNLFGDEMLVRKLMKRELFQVSFYSMAGKMLKFKVNTSNLINMIDNDTAEKFLSDYVDFVTELNDNAMDGKALLNLGASANRKSDWQIYTTLSIAIPREGRNAEELLKTFNRLQNFQDIVKLSLYFDIGLLPVECTDDDDEPLVVNNYVLHTFGPFALSAFAVDDEVITITFQNAYVHQFMVDNNIPEGMDTMETIDYNIERARKFENENKPVKAIPKPKEKKPDDKKNK